MIITPQNQESVIKTFREYPAGLSISELSRKCGLNRNKCSQICSDYHKKNILGLVERSSYKIYFLRHQSILNNLIDSISGPVLVVNESFSVISVNQEYGITFRTNPDEILGRAAEELLRPLCPDLISDLRQQLGPGMTGRAATFPDKTGATRCKTLTIAVNESQFCIIIFTVKTPSKDLGDDRMTTVESRFTAAVPTLLKQSWPEALGEISALLHETITDTLIFTLLIDERLKTCTVHTIATPGTESLPSVQPDTLPLPLTGIEILQYKTGKPVTYYTSTPDSLRNTPLPEKIKKVCPQLGITSISLLGINSDSNLTSVIGIGTLNPAASTAYIQLLRAVSGYLNLLCAVCQHATEMLKMSTEYQKHYSDIYALLTEKTQENAAHNVEAEHLRSFLGAVLDTRQISLIAVTRNGALIAANKTACATYGITPEHLTNHVSIGEALPDLAPSLQALIPDETGDHPGQTTRNLYIEKRQKILTHWYLLSPDGTSPAAACTFLFIGEQSPASLIKYLTSRADLAGQPGN